MAARAPSPIFKKAFELLCEQSLERADEVVDETLSQIASDLYEFSKEYGFDYKLAEDELHMLGVEP